MRFLALPAVALVLFAACGPAQTPGPSTPTVTLPDSGATVAPAAVDAGNAPVWSADAGPRMCGCALCEPKVSEDACKVDADCAAATPCHATECVAKAKAEPRAANTQCTQLFACASVDANPCGCYQGHCALVPRPPKP
jgi:hypothetical protein